MMPKSFAHHLGRALACGLFGLCATGAIAGDRTADTGEVVVSQRPSSDTRSVAIRVSDLDLRDAYAQRTLELRIDAAAREVCDVNAGSEIDKLPRAQTCLAAAREGALAQLQARGVFVPAKVTAGGGMR
jgi:UrcA family protein